MKNLLQSALDKAKSIDLDAIKKTSSEYSKRAEKAVKDIDWDKAKERKDAFVDKLGEAAKKAQATFYEIQEREREKALQIKLKKELKRQERMRKWEALIARVRLFLKVVAGIFVLSIVAFICFRVFYPEQYHQFEQERKAEREALEQQRLAREKQREIENEERAKSSANSSGQTDRARSVQKSYQGLDMDRGDFDVGRYCLNQEKKGAITFEQCLGLAVAKASGKR